MRKKNHIEYILPIIYGLCVFLFFWKMFPHHLHFQEQFQLFLYQWDYFIETFARPGGFSNYAGRFIVQFFLFSSVGALLMSFLLVSIQQLVNAIIRRFREHSAGLFLSFLPSLAYWFFLCDENSLTGGVVALLLTLIVTLVGTFPKTPLVRRVYLFVSIPVLYWLAGGSVILSVLLLILYEWRSRHSLKIKPNVLPIIFSSIAAIVLTISLPYIAKYFLVQYTLERFWWGVDYIRYVTYSPFVICFLWILILLIVIGVIFFPVFKKIRTTIAWAIQILALLLSIYLVIAKAAYPQNANREELMAYDFYCKTQNWNKIIEMADKKSPTIPMTVSCLNLALFKTGQLPEKMFNYFQNGHEGLIPDFQRDFMVAMVAGEPYYYLGFVNSAQRFTVEAMDAIPDYQKSVRGIKRLAETNLINGYYEVTAKYLNLLEHTLFYKKWAKEARTYLYNEAIIDAHPEWGEIRRFQTKEDFLFSSNEMDMMLGICFRQNPDNRMAYEYLMAYTLLVKDIKNFPAYFQMKKNFTYPRIPKSWQEALVYIWGLSNNDLNAIPVPIDNSVKQQVTAYAKTYTTIQSPEAILQKQYSNTYWYYFHFRKYNRPKAEQSFQY